MSSPPESEIGGHHAISEDEDEPGRDDEDVERGAVEGFILSDDAEPAQSTSGGRYSPKRDGQAFRTSNKPWESHAPLLDREGFENGNDAHTLDDSPAQPQGSPDGSLSNPDDTPSVQGSMASSLGREIRDSSRPVSRLSSSPSIRPFDRRLQSRISSSPLSSPRAQSPAFLSSVSRLPSLMNQASGDQESVESEKPPWEVMRWTKLKKLASQAFSEMGRRSFGRPMCIAIAAFIVLGTSKGVILLFDYNQDLKSIFGPGTKAVESGPILSLAISADHSIIAGGHANGSIFTWDTAGAAKPFLQISPLDARPLSARKTDGHIADVGVLHLGFLGSRHTALVSADGRGMAFSHLATRGLGPLHRAVKTTRILGRYPDDSASIGRPRKPSAVLAFSALPLGNVEQAPDTMGLVAMLTPYLLVIVSTTPIAQTQHKVGRPKDVPAHGALSGCLAWFPSVRLKGTDDTPSDSASKVKLVYCWLNVLTILDVSEIEPSDPTNRDRPPNLSFRARSRWKAGESIVAVQWLGRSVLAVLTITQQLLILEDNSLEVTEAVDLMNKQIFHHDFFSNHLQPIVDQLDEDDTSMHGVVADAFFTSFRVYKGRIFLLGLNDLFVGTLCNWSQRLTALTEAGNFVGAIRLATLYYHGEVDRLTISLPDNDRHRHRVVQEKLLEVMASSMEHTLGRGKKPVSESANIAQLQELSDACIAACVDMDACDFLFDDIYERYEQNASESIFLETLEPYILEGRLTSAPPLVVKSLVEHYMTRNSEGQLEEMICRMDTATMDIDQITTLCKQYNLYDALIYVWNQALGDYITPLVELLSFLVPPPSDAIKSDDYDSIESSRVLNVVKIFPYLSYTLTGRVYPTGADRVEEDATRAKAELYSFLFAGKTVTWPRAGGKPILTHWEEGWEPSFPYLHLLLSHDAASFLSALNEAFEDNFLNGASDNVNGGGQSSDAADDQLSDHKINRQYIISILLEVMDSDEFNQEQTIYLDMFIARNLPKFPQFILLSGTSLHRVLVGLCNYPSEAVAEDCQLSVEYLLSMYRPSDLETLIPLFEGAGFYRVLKFVYKAENQYGKLLEVYFKDVENQEEVFDCMKEILRPKASVKSRQLREVQDVIKNYASRLLLLDTRRTAEVIDRYTDELHEYFLAVLESNPQAQYVYLRTILETTEKGAPENGRASTTPYSTYIGQYIPLMCKYDPSHVVDYISSLQAKDLRLEQILPAIESEGVVDAAVVLMARGGHVRRGLNRLLKHLDTLEAALLGLLSASAEIPSSPDEEQAAADILAAIHKYVTVGIWLCQGPQTATDVSDSSAKQMQRLSLSEEGELSSEELLWLDLLDTIVRIVKNSTYLLHPLAATEFSPTHSPAVPHSNDVDSTIITTLRALVQQAFTALLTSTTSTKRPSAPERPGFATIPTSSRSSSSRPTTTSRSKLSFLRILRAFLTRATLTSPSLSDLRTVLSSIFYAYAYEESLLSLSLKLLEKDLFVRVADAAERRRRGWRPRSQMCEGCGRRVWGPGAGAGIWDAWRVREVDGRHSKRVRRVGEGDVVKDGLDDKKDKGKSVATDDDAEGRGLHRSNAILRRGGEGRVDPQLEQAEASHRPQQPQEREEEEQEQLGPLVIFACQHVFHKRCLERLSVASKEEEDDDEQRRGRHDMPLDETSSVAAASGWSPRRLRCVVCR